MRVPYRASKRSLNYSLEAMEQRYLLSAAVPAVATVPADWVAYPADEQVIPIVAGLHPNQDATPQGVVTPAQMQSAYGANGITFGGVVGNGQGQTIAIVDAYDYPTAAADLAAFDTYYNLPAPPSFAKFNEQGLPGPLPTTDPAGPGGDDWEGEEALDIEWAHVMAPDASIDLFEANDPDGDNLYITARSAARTAGVSVVSMSFSADETATETSLDSYFTTPAGHQGVTFVAAAGDSGIYDPSGSTPAPQYPDSSPNVVSVGGTTLTVNSDGSYGGEVGWGSGTESSDPEGDGGGGGGISLYESQPAYQRFLDTESSTQRTYPDVAMDADPESGVGVYDSYDNGTQTPWLSGVGGTSLATPMFAALVAIADQGRVSEGLTTLDGASQTLPRLYNLPEADFHDITNGDNGYQAGVGYDLVTGRGSPVANVLIPDLAAQYIGSYLFNDANLNGIQNSGETGIAGITVSLKVPTNGTITSGDTTLETTTTDAFGLYEFTNVAAGNYYVNFTLPTGYAFSPVGTGSVVTANSVVNPATGDTPIFAITAASGYDLANGGAYSQTISIDNVTVTRPQSGLEPMVFTVTLSPANLNVTDVTYSTADGTATVANDDYIPTSGTLVFPVGVTTETITVDAVGNLKIENNVYFDVNISVPTGYLGLQTTGVGTIDNNNFPVATVAGPPAQTRSSLVPLIYPFVISLSAPAPFTVSVPFTTVDQSAVAGVDYLGDTGSAVFLPGSTSQTVDISVYAGTNRQLDKTFLLELTTPAAPITETVGTPSQASATILTNALPAVNANPGSVTESVTGLAYLPFTVDVTPTLTSVFTVNYTTSDGTAIAGKDYQAEAGSLTFSPGRVEQTVYVPVYRQFIAAQTKTLSFTISDPSTGIDLVSPVVTGTINYVTLSALPFTAAKKAIYTDALDQRVTVSMKGAGIGDVVFLGGISNATNAYEIVVDGTNAASQVTVQVARGGQTSLTNLIASANVGTINAKTTNIVGSVAATGSIGTLDLGYVEGSSVSVGGAGSGQTLSLNFNRVLNSSLTSAIDIKSLTAYAYVNTTGSPIYITAPHVGGVKVKQNLTGITINTTTLTTMQVGGTIEGGALLASDSIGSVMAGGISNSTFFAGVNSGQTTLPTAASQFSNTSSQIQSIRVTDGLFSNSLIAGWTVKHVSVAKSAVADSASVIDDLV